jgi:hypothetical protein
LLAIVIDNLLYQQVVGADKRVDYETFHRAVEAANGTVPSSEGFGASLRLDTGVMQRADFETGLEFKDDDPSVRAAKKDVCRKVRKHLQMHLIRPRNAFLAVDKNRDGLVTQPELRSWVFTFARAAVSFSG